MMRTFTLSLALLCVITNFTATAQTHTPRYISMTASSNGYYEYLPAGYNNAGNTSTYPVILFIHGLGETGDGSPAQLPKVLVNGPPKLINNGTFPSSFTVNGQTFQFIVISPQFNAWPNAVNINNIIDYLVANYRIDLNRIYLTGLSMGGGGVWDYAGYNNTYATRLAAIIPICGASSPSVFRANVIAAANLPVWATHNLNDPTCPVSFTNDYISYIENAPVPSTVPPKKTIFNANGHDAWTTTYNPNWRENGIYNVYEWMLLNQRNNTVLPILLETFSGKEVNASVLLEWRTSFEQDNSHFIIERSADGINFVSIGTVTGKNLPNGSSYNFTDNSPIKGANFYRLCQVNFDGNKKCYETITVRVSKNINSLVSVYPNPASVNIWIKVSVPETGTFNLQIAQADGKIVRQEIIQKNTDVFLKQVPIEKLPKGLYVIKIAGNGVSESVIFSKQ